MLLQLFSIRFADLPLATWARQARSSRDRKGRRQPTFVTPLRRHVVQIMSREPGRISFRARAAGRSRRLRWKKLLNGYLLSSFYWMSAETRAAKRRGGGQAVVVVQKRKGCDIGYALAANSCERANDVDACTVTAFDAITAFAVPNPGVSSQIRRIFQVWSRASRPALRITQPTSDWQRFMEPTLSAVDETHHIPFVEVVNARF